MTDRSRTLRRKDIPVQGHGVESLRCERIEFTNTYSESSSGKKFQSK